MQIHKNILASMQAHNTNKEEASYNDSYNKAKRLGTWLGRTLCTKVASWTYGNRSHKITVKDLQAYAIYFNTTIAEDKI